jgi:cobalt-zinc-cadmium efflux system outer membrane protein
MPLRSFHASTSTAAWAGTILTVVLGLFGVMSSGAHAQPTADAVSAPSRPGIDVLERDTLTFEAARQLLLANHPMLHRTRAEVRARRRDADADAQFPNPSVSALQEWTNLEPGGSDDQWFLNLAQPLRYPGEHAAYRERAHAVGRAGEGYVAETRAELYRELRSRYLSVVAADARRAVHEQFSEAIRAADRAAEIRYEEGDLGTFQRARLRAARAEAENLQSEAKLKQATARTTLLAFLRPDGSMGAAETGETSMTDRLPPHALLPVAGQLRERPVRVDAQAARRRAAEQRGRLAAARAEVDVAGQALRAARYQRYPSIQLTAGPRRQRIPGATTYGYTAGVTVGLPLWNTGRAAADAERSRQAVATAQRETARRTVEMQVRNAVARVRSYRERLNRLDDDAADPDALLSDAVFVYREGEIELFELLDAVTAARETALLRIQLIEQYLQALHELEFAVGVEPNDRPLLLDGALDVHSSRL